MTTMSENGNGKKAWVAILSGAAVLTVGVFGWLFSASVQAQSRLTALEVHQTQLRRDMDSLSYELRETRMVIEGLRVELRETRTTLDRPSHEWRRPSLDQDG